MARQHRLDDLIDELNQDLASELGTIIRYTYQAAKVAGPSATRVRELLRGELSDELEHAAYLTETIVRLGGEPTTVPAEFDKPCSLRIMLEVDLLMGQANTRRYRRHARLAGELNELEIEDRLEAMAAVEAGHAREIELILTSLA